MEKDKELDDLFKSGLDGPGSQPVFRDDDWEAMEAMLDGHKKRPGIVYWLPILSGVAALLLIVFGLWMIIRKPTKNQEATNNRISPKDTSYQKQRHPGISDGSIQRQTRNLASNHDTITQANAASRKSVISSGSIATNTTNRRQGSPISTASADGGRRNTAGYDSLQTNRNKVTDDKLLASAGNLPGVQSTINDTITPRDILPKAGNAITAANKPKIRLVAPAYHTQLAISVLGSSDLNGVSTFAQSKLGTNVGLLFSAGVTKRFTISTGAIYSSKPYLTNFDNYNGSFKFPNTPTTVSADCQMFDIPVNVDYNFYNKHRNKFSIGTGISSYLMFHENYAYAYGAGGYGPANYNVASPGKYYLSILNLQATYQRQINSKVGLDIQPYMKLPLSGVGLYNSRLQSTGVAVGLTWNLGQR